MTPQETKHTAGPWSAHKSADGLYRVRGNIGQSIAKDLTAEDARLIAAAPQMFEALDNLICSACENRIGWKGEMSPTDRRTDWRTCPYCKEARAALRAARGE